MTNQTQATDPNDQNVVEFGDSPGRRLRVQRQSRGLTLERIASQLHLRPEIVEALEQDRFDLLPDPVFITGYLRNYARVLGLDPLPLIAAYQTHAGTPKIVEPTRPMPGMQRDSGSTRILVRLVSLALAAAVVAMVALWWHDRPELSPELGLDTTDPDTLAVDDEDLDTPSPPMSDPEPPQTTESIPTDRVATPRSIETIAERDPVDPDPSETGILSPAFEGAGLPETTSDSPPEQPTGAIERTSSPAGVAPEPDPAPEEEPVTPTAPKGIVLEFTGPSWLEVRDASGQRLIVGEMKAGDRREVAGQPPFRFTVGRVSNSRMTVDGEPFDLESRSRGNVARFSLDPESPE